MANLKSFFDDNEVALVLPEQLENLKLPEPSLVNFYTDISKRRIYLNCEIDSTLVEYMKYIVLWNEEDYGKPVEERKPIRILINSPGGDVPTMWNIVDTINMSKTPVYTYNIGSAHSAAVAILISGHKRYCYENSTLLIHEGYAGVGDVAGKVQDTAAYFKDMSDKIKNYILSKTNIDKRTYSKKQRSEWYLNAQDQLKLGLVDNIIHDIDDILG